jgi:hypothetical protein
MRPGRLSCTTTRDGPLIIIAFSNFWGIASHEAYLTTSSIRCQSWTDIAGHSRVNAAIRAAIIHRPSIDFLLSRRVSGLSETGPTNQSTITRAVLHVGTWMGLDSPQTGQVLKPQQARSQMLPRNMPDTMTEISIPLRHGYDQR